MNARSLCRGWQLQLMCSFRPGAVFTSNSASAASRRWCETQHFVREMSGGESNDDMEEELSEFLGAHLAPKKKKTRREEEEESKYDTRDSRTVFTLRREVLQLYRTIWRASRLMTHTDPTGKPWQEIIRESTRKEFEQAKHLRDSEEILKRVVSGRDHLTQVLTKIAEKYNNILAEKEKKEREALQPPTPWWMK